MKETKSIINNILSNIKYNEIKCPVCESLLYNPKTEYCYNCEKKLKKKMLDIERLGGELAYINFTLDKYEMSEQIKEKIKEYPGKNLYIWGDVGTGKTHLATALVRQFDDGLVIKIQQIFREIRNNLDIENVIINKYVNKNYLVIDDIGVEKTTDFNFNILYEIIDRRYMKMKKGLIITSNLSLDKLAEKLGDDRIPSRIAGMSVIIKLEGRDRRLIK